MEPVLDFYGFMRSVARSSSVCVQAVFVIESYPGGNNVGASETEVRTNVRNRSLCLHRSPLKIHSPTSSVALYETCLRFVLPLCSHLPHAIAPTPISSIVTIIDLRDTTIRQMWTLRNHLQEASVLANANYPETLSTLVVVGVPGWWGTVWAWVKVSLGLRAYVDVFT